MAHKMVVNVKDIKEMEYRDLKSGQVMRGFSQPNIKITGMLIDDDGSVQVKSKFGWHEVIKNEGEIVIVLK